MYRQGKYTKKLSPVQKSKRFVHDKWVWFKGLSRTKKIIFIGAPILAFLIITPILTYLYYYNDIGDQERLLNRNNTGVVLTDINGKEFYQTPGTRAKHRDLVPLNDIADTAEQAAVASEDKDFYEHAGFSPLGIIRAMYGNLVAREITGGGSTITQQLAKNTLLTEQQTVLRKYQELTIALAIEHRYSKEQILTMYLNSVYFGENSFGLEDAAKNYFDKKPSELTLAESSMLVGVLPAPSLYSPISGDPELAKERQTTVLSRMVRNGYITEEQKTKALSEKLAYAEPSSGISNDAPHFTEMVLAELYEKYGEEKVTRSGYQVKTTIDLKLQEAANQAVDDNMAFIKANNGSNAGVVAIDPATGEIRALVGSADYDNDKFGKVNMATSARQPGSTFKSIYYADALASSKITPVTILNDAPITDIEGGQDIKNADRSFRGKVTVRQALNWSLNIPSVRVMQKEGLDSAISAAEKVGITTIDKDKNYGYSLALGSAEVPLVEMTNAYATYANKGEHNDYISIQSIRNKYDNAIFTAKASITRGITAQGAYLISNILSDRAAKQKVFGDSLTVYGTDGQAKNVAVKTGTTDDNRDAWTIGYTPDIAIGVWVGNNDNEAMFNGGSGMAGPIWKQAMKAAIGSKKPEFVQPSGITKTSVCTDVGTLTDVFLTNNVPKECAKQEEKQEEKPKKDETKQTESPCTIEGKESLSADDPDCVVDPCEFDETLAANDPNCVDPATQDDDNDGVPNEQDTCPDTPTGEAVDANGCSTSQKTPSGGTGGGSGTGGPRTQGAVLPRRLQ